MQKHESEFHRDHVKRAALKKLTKATASRETAELREILAAHSAREAGLKWREIADAASKGSAASAASYFGDSMADRASKREAARQRANSRNRNHGSEP